MKWMAAAIIALLVGYSAALVCVEWSTSQDYVRHFMTDIEGPVPFYAVNTTISVYLLWTTALLFAICLFCVRGLPGHARLQYFCFSQIVVFGWLGADDRFKLHEHIAWLLGIGDHFILLAVALVEVSFLLVLAGSHQLLRPWTLGSLAAASVLFTVMIVFDAIVPHDMTLRLTLEDLAKTWACACFLVFAWQFCGDRIEHLRCARFRELDQLRAGSGSAR